MHHHARHRGPPWAHEPQRFIAATGIHPDHHRRPGAALLASPASGRYQGTRTLSTKPKVIHNPPSPPFPPPSPCHLPHAPSAPQPTPTTSTHTSRSLTTHHPQEVTNTIDKPTNSTNHFQTHPTQRYSKETKSKPTQNLPHHKSPANQTTKHTNTATAKPAHRRPKNNANVRISTTATQTERTRRPIP